MAVVLRSLLGVAALAGASATSKERPVMKIVRLLQDMKSELERDLDDDKAVHEKMDCWCKTNDQEKTAAIEAAQQTITSLEAYLAEAAAKMAELKAKRDTTLDEVNKDEAALQEAATLRMEANKENQADKMNLIEAIKACDGALVVLGKHNAGLAQVRAVAQKLQHAQVLERVEHTLDARDMLALRTFVTKTETASSFLAVPGYKSYAPQSGQIFGVLGQLKEGFERNLAEVKAKEWGEAEQHAMLKAAKMEEIAAGRKLVAELDQNIAEVKEKHAQAFKELEDTQEQLGLDSTFLGNLRAKCSSQDAEFDQRVKDRLVEIAAVEETIKILNSDESFDAFDDADDSAGYSPRANFEGPGPVDSTISTVHENSHSVTVQHSRQTSETLSFLQAASSGSTQERMRRATAVLTKAAALTGGPELSMIAARVQLDNFVKVKAEIDKMIAMLKTQQQDESDHRDWCLREMRHNNATLTKTYTDKNTWLVLIGDLEKTLTYLNKELAGAKEALKEIEEQMKRASEVREAENNDYLTTISDQRITQRILEKAIARMSQVYALMQQQPGAPHIETSGTKTDPGNGPARFANNDKHKGGGKVIRMLEEVMADSKKTEDESIAAEQDAQQAYENFMMDSNKALAAYLKKQAHLIKAIASSRQQFIQVKVDLKSTVRNLGQTHDTLADMEKACRFILDTFTARQAARQAEIDALNEAKAILSGMN